MPVMQRSEVPVADLTSPEPDRRILLTGGFVITMDPGIGDVTGDVLIVGDRIRAVGRGLAELQPFRQLRRPDPGDARQGRSPARGNAR